MNNPYDLHWWSKHYREEALQEAQRQHLIERTRAAERGRAGRGEQRPLEVALASLLRWARLAG